MSLTHSYDQREISWSFIMSENDALHDQNHAGIYRQFSLWNNWKLFHFHRAITNLSH